MNNEAISRDWEGRVVGSRFRLLEWIGSAGQSGVYVCEVNGNPEQKAAIKLFPADAPGAESCASGWTTASSLFHPHVIGVLATGQDRISDTDVLYVVTEYAGEVLSEILPARALTPKETKEMLGPILDALAYLHEKSLVHGRLKPSNIMVVDDQLKLSVENIRGAPGMAVPPEAMDIYDAPERAQNRIELASDMWSLGITLVETLTQIPPVWNRSSGSEPIVPPSVAKPFGQIARECLRLDPSLRCTLDEVKACLESGAAIPHRSAIPRPAAQPAAKPVRKRRVAAIAASAVVMLAAFAVVMLHSHRATATSQAEEQTATSAPVAAEATPAAANPAPAQAAAQPAPIPESQAPPAPEPAPQQSAATAAAPITTSQAAQSATPLAAPQTAPGTTGGKGAVAQRVMPDVPAKAEATIHGTIKVGIQVHVDGSGSVSDASIGSQGPSKYFANLALQSARSWKFTPPEVNGQGVPSSWLLEFAFRQSGTEVTPSEQTP
jgi:TonB family protein